MMIRSAILALLMTGVVIVVHCLMRSRNRGLGCLVVCFLGASLKEMGTGFCAVSEMIIAPETILGLLE